MTTDEIERIRKRYPNDEVHQLADALEAAEAEREADYAALADVLRWAREFKNVTHEPTRAVVEVIGRLRALEVERDALLAERRELRAALEVFLGARWDIGMHDSGDGVTHRFDGDGAATGCSWCQTKANARALLAKTERTTR